MENIIGSGLLLQMVKEYMLLMKIKNIDIFMKNEKIVDVTGAGDIVTALQ